MYRFVHFCFLNIYLFIITQHLGTGVYECYSISKNKQDPFMRLLKPLFFKTKSYIVLTSCDLKCQSSISVQKYKTRRYEWVSNLVKYFSFSFWTVEEKWYKQSNTSESMNKQTFHPLGGFGQVERAVTALIYILCAILLKSRKGALWTWVWSTSD